MKMIYNGISYYISDNCVSVRDSYKVTDDEVKLDFLIHVCSEKPDLESHRSKESMLEEWKAHNILYQKHLFRSRTKDVDIEYNQKWIFKVGYHIICKLFKEKMYNIGEDE